MIRRGLPPLRPEGLREGFTLLEIVPVLSLAVALLTFTILALAPSKQYGGARNTTRKHDLALIADAIISYTNDNDRGLFLRIPTDNLIEICGDSFTGACDGLLNINALVGTHLQAIPIDPGLSDEDDPDGIHEHSRYFIVRSGNRITISAPDTEPLGLPDITISR
jgi:type II secretory pathway pseudopilin PulG